MRFSAPRSPARAALLIASLLALASAAGLSGTELMKAELGFGGYTAPGRWVPLWISSSGGPKQARLEVIRLGAEGREIGRESFPLPPGLRLECPVAIGPELESLAIRLTTVDGTLAETRLEARSKIFPGHIVLACGLPVQARLAIGSALLPSEPIQTVAVEAADLPANGLDYDGVSGLAMLDRGPQLSPAQRAALLGWLAGGGRLAILADRGGEDSLFASLGLPGAGGVGPRAEGRAGDGARDSSVPTGLGGVVRIPRDPSELPQSPEFWRDSLALSPYGRVQRLGEGSFGRELSVSGGPDSEALIARALIFAAAALWTLSALATAFLTRGRARRAAIMAALALALVLIAGPALDRSLRQGLKTRALALILPFGGPHGGADSGAAAGDPSASVFVRAIVTETKPLSLFAWMSIKALRPLALDYRDESLAPPSRPDSENPEWKHGLPRAALSLRTAGGGSLVLAGLLDLGSLSFSSLPRGALAYRRQGIQPPELSSPGPLAFVAPESLGLWWEKLPGGAWTRLEKPPLWLDEDEAWIRRLRAGSPSLAFLIGRGAAPALGLSLAGAPLHELSWVLPLGQEER
jgi:hypothetical protein